MIEQSHSIPVDLIFSKLVILHFRYATKVNAIHFQTSAKHNIGVEDMFLALTQKMVECAAEQESSAEAMTRQNSQRRNVVVVDDDEAPPPPSKHCCGSS